MQSSQKKNQEERSAFEQLGGDEGIHRIIEDFIERVYHDPIIGFFFLQVNKSTLIQRETEFASNHLGGKISYGGQTIAQAHKKHPINKGHFHRRLWLLENTLKEHKVPSTIIEQWLNHNRLLESIVTDGSDCQPKPHQKEAY